MFGIDIISDLSESLLTKILSYLPMKDSVKTSVLSTRWKNQWLNVPVFELEHNDIPFGGEEVIISLIDKYLQFNPELCLWKFKIKSSSLEIEGLKDRIATVIDRGVEHLDVKSSVSYLEEDGPYPFIDLMPLNLYTSKTLVSLKLSRSGLEDTGFVSLPCLKLLRLWKIRWSGTMTLEKFLAGCPVLEELTLLRDLGAEYEDFGIESVVTRVRSRTLKRFYVPPKRKLSNGQRPDYILEIDAPGLEYMSLKEDHFDRIIVKNLTSLFTIDLDIKFFVNPGMSLGPEDLSKRNEILDFLTGISSVRQMIISQKTVKALDLYSKAGLIPKFNNLTGLEAVFLSSSLQFLPTFLESCPKLKHLTLVIGYSELDVLELTKVPQCFESTLERVEIKGIFEWKEREMKIASYFLENSAVLKKLILSYVYRTHALVVPDLDSQLTKRSRECRICWILKKNFGEVM